MGISTIFGRFDMFDNIKRSSKGAIDLASIMVGIVVIGLIGGVIAATIFAIIPWAQDNAAKHQLDAIATAQSAYAGFAASEASGLSSLVLALPTASVEGKQFATLEQLNAKGLFKSEIQAGNPTLSADGKVCTAVDQVKGSFNAAVVSGSGNVFTIDANNLQPIKVDNGITCVGSVANGELTPPEPVKPPIMVTKWDTIKLGLFQHCHTSYLRVS